MNPIRRLPAVTAETTLLPWLLVSVPDSNRTRIKQMLRGGSIVVNGKPRTKHDHPLRPGDTVTIARPEIEDRSLEEARINVLYEDDVLIAIDKPAGLLTVATETEREDTAFARLNEHLTARDQGRPYVVHRLDRDTSGVLLFARLPEIRDQLQASWAEVTKIYLAVVKGQPRDEEGTIENYLLEGSDYRVRVVRTEEHGAQKAISKYRVLKTKVRYSLIEVELVTGRKHQIRVHMNGLACPIIGDPIYGKKAGDPAERLGLHATRLSFNHPVTEERITLESPIPRKLLSVCGFAEA